MGLHSVHWLHTAEAQQKQSVIWVFVTYCFMNTEDSFPLRCDAFHPPYNRVVGIYTQAWYCMYTNLPDNKNYITAKNYIVELQFIVSVLYIFVKGIKSILTGRE